MLNLKIKKNFLCTFTLSLISISQVHASAVVNASNQPPNVLAPYAVSDSNLGVAGGSKAYRPWFENGAFSGDLIEYDISANGDLITDITFPTATTAAAATGSNWSARVQLDAKNGTYWTDTRKIIFHNGAAQKAFRWGNLSASQKTGIGSNDKLDYVRGDTSNEGTLRTRVSLLGDIIHSNPVYIAAPDAKFTLTGYGAFKTDKANRAKRVYVGANDGMLHVFNADNGDEVYAYIPSMLINDLDKLTVSPLTHTYFVDGQLAEGDAYFDAGSGNEWRSLLVGGLGSGGKGIFALDITNPNLTSELSSDAVDKKILWEIDGTDDDMGYIHGKSQVARLPDGNEDDTDNNWAVITGNGYGSTSTRAKLLIISMDGSVTKINAGTETANGLSAPTLVDTDGDDDIDIGFAGDLQGDLWKFTFNDDGSVGVDRIFEGSVNKPITSAPEVRIHPIRGYLVYFGTGSLLSEADAEYTATKQSIYALWDEAPSGTTFLEQTLATATYVAQDGTERLTRIVTDNHSINWAEHKGWTMELAITGERIITKPIMRANRLQLVTHVSDDLLNGEAWLLQLNYLNGGTGETVFLDVDNSGALDDDDETTQGDIPVGIFLGEGSFSQPTIARIDVDDDATFINAIIFDIDARTPCVTDCNNGFLAGHIDVDTDSPRGPTKATRVADYSCYIGGKRPTYVNGTTLPLTTPTQVTETITVEDEDNCVTTTSRRGRTRTVCGTKQVTKDSRDEDTELSSRREVDGLGGEVDGHVHEYDKANGQVYVDFIELEPRCAQSRVIGSGTNDWQKIERMSEVEIPDNKLFFAVIANADLSPYSTFTLGTVKWNVMDYQVLIQKKLDAWVLAGQNNSGANSFENMMKDDNNHSLLHKYEDFFDANGVLTGTIRHSFNDEAIADGGLLSTKYSCVTDDAERNFSESTRNGVTTYNTGRWRGGALVTQLIAVTEYTADPTRVIKQTPTDLYRSRTYKDSSGTMVPVTLKSDTVSYGGLRLRNRTDAGIELTGASANPAFLYEMSLYWHNPDNLCYGNSNWLSDLSSIDENSSNDVIGDFSDTIGSLEYQLEQNDARLETLLAIPEEDRTEEEKQEIRNLNKIIELLKLKINQIRDIDKVLIDTGTVKTRDELDLNLTPSLGPNFRTGRRTWIDITP